MKVVTLVCFFLVVKTNLIPVINKIFVQGFRNNFYKFNQYYFFVLVSIYKFRGCLHKEILYCSFHFHTVSFLTIYTYFDKVDSNFINPYCFFTFTYKLSNYLSVINMYHQGFMVKQLQSQIFFNNDGQLSKRHFYHFSF